MTCENESSLLKELKGLNLNRYINEIVSAITTAQIRLIDVPTVVKVLLSCSREISPKICSFLHQNYAEFTTELLPSLRKVVSPAAKEPLTKRRSVLRLLIDLYTSGVYDDLPIVYSLVESIKVNFVICNSSLLSLGGFSERP
jgi:regulator of nonsense transcripts 2